MNLRIIMPNLSGFSRYAVILMPVQGKTILLYMTSHFSTTLWPLSDAATVSSSACWFSLRRYVRWSVSNLQMVVDSPGYCLVNFSHNTFA